MTQIGHASIDENGRACYGKAGDQNGREVLIQNWYSHPWHTVIRPINSSTAKKIAYTMKAICNNNNIGYDQTQRKTLYDLASKVNWDISKIKTPCETDCSAAVCVCVNASGIKVSPLMYTGNELEILKGTGKFTILKDVKYTKSPDYLKSGDILLANGHTAIVVSNGSKVKEVIVAKHSPTKFDAKFNKQFVVTKDAYIRDGAGKRFKTFALLRKDTKVRCYGKYDVSSKYPWLFVEVEINGLVINGYVLKNKLK